MRPPRAVAGLAALGITAGCLAAVPALAAPALAATDSSQSTAFHRTATYPVFQNLPAAEQSSATVAEISAVSEDGTTLVYTDAAGKRVGFLDITDPGAPVGRGSIDLTESGHADDQPTSVAIVGDRLIVVIDETGGDFAAPRGRADVYALSTRVKLREIDLGGQPDSITISKDKKFAAIAMENQRDESFAPDGKKEGDLPQAPGGFVQILDIAGEPDAWSTTKVPFTNDDGSALASFTAAGIVEPTDPEPEYVTINSAGTLAVTLQENNGIVLIDLASKEIDRVFSAGSASVTGIDTTKDSTFNPTGSISDTPREPDAIAWIGTRYLATANEGDWKGGTRGWTVFDATTGAVAWDAGNSFERIATADGLFNNDRAAKKGTEPEGLAVAEIGGTPYAFVGSERSNFVAVYDVSDPSNPDYTQTLPATNGPEGILPIPGRNLLAVSSETDDASVNVRASVSLFELGAGEPEFPSIVSKSSYSPSGPIGWSALGALTADPAHDDQLFTASDSAVKPARIYTVDVSSAPATITKVTSVTDSAGKAQNLDIEGLFARPAGGFWAASEGATGAENALYRLSSAGVVEETVPLPTDVTSHIGKWGLEGVTATVSGGTEYVWAALQRPQFTDVAKATGDASLDGAGVTRIGRYNTATKSWYWFGYQLESTSATGDWMGLSEITAIDENTLAVIERDKLNGPAAAVKRIYTVEIPATDPGKFTVLPKKLAIDVLPKLRATNGWTQEKLEGFTVAGNGNAYAITDNDALKDATGETVLLNLGSAADVFTPSTPTPTPTPTATATASPAPVPTVTVTATPAPVATTTPAPKPGAAASKVKVWKKNVAHKRKALTVAVASKGKRVTGTVVVTEKGRVLATTTITTKASKKVTIRLPKLSRGSRSVRVHYLGTSKVATSATTVTLTQR